MKKHIFYLSGLILTAILFHSCNWWYDCGCSPLTTPSTISILQTGSDTILAGSTVSFELLLGTSNGYLTTLEVIGLGSIQPAPGSGIVSTRPENKWDIEKKEFVKGTASVTVFYNLIIDSGLKAGDKLEIEFKVSDEKDLFNTVRKIITISGNQ